MTDYDYIYRSLVWSGLVAKRPINTSRSLGPTLGADVVHLNNFSAKAEIEIFTWDQYTVY